MNVDGRFSGALTQGWVPDGLIPKYHFDTELHILCYSHAVVDIVQLRTLLLKVLCFTEDLGIIHCHSANMKKHKRGSAHSFISRQALAFGFSHSSPTPRVCSHQSCWSRLHQLTSSFRLSDVCSPPRVVCWECREDYGRNQPVQSTEEEKETDVVIW